MGYKHFNEMSIHEPIGAKVLLQFESGIAMIAWRKEPTTERGVPNTYYTYRYDALGKLVGDRPIDFTKDKPIGWTYP